MGQLRREISRLRKEIEGIRLTYFSHEAGHKADVAELDTKVRRTGDGGVGDELDSVGSVAGEVGVDDGDWRLYVISKARKKPST